MTQRERFEHEYDLDALETIRPVGHGFEMVVTPRHRRPYGERPYEPFLSTLLGAMSARRSLFVDVGAHYGFFSLVAGEWNPEIEIVACEPVPANHDVLLRNLERNGLSRARVLRQAVSDAVGTERFHISLASDNCSFYPHPVAPPIQEVEVETVTLDRLLAGHEPVPAVVKVDTDGHEIRVLDGMTETLERFGDLALFLELNPKMLRAAGREPDELLADLDRRRLDVFVLDETDRRARRVRRADAWRELMPDPERYVNLYCRSRERSLSVAFVSHSARLAGAERSLLELVSELVSDHGALCTVLLPETGPLEARLTAAGASTLVAPYSWWGVAADADPPGAPEGGERSFEEWLGPSAQMLLGDPLEALRGVDPDVVVSNTIAVPWGSLLAPVLGRPHAWHVCEPVDTESFRFPVPYDEMVEMVVASSALVFTATESIGAELFRDRPAVTWRSLYRHVEAPRIERGGGRGVESEAPALFRRPGAVRLLQLASFAPVKGQDVVIGAVERVVAAGADVELAVVGGGREDYRAAVAAAVERAGLGDRVHLERFVDDGLGAMRQADVVLIGARRDAFCRTAAEAMTLGKAVVYPRLGGPKEYMVDGETGLGYEPGDADGMATAILELARDPELRRRLGLRARAKAVATFSRDRFGGTAYRALLALRGGEARIAPRWLALLAHLARETKREAALWRDRHDGARRAREDLVDRLAAADERESDLRRRVEEEKARRITLERREADGRARLARARGERDVVLRSHTFRLALALRRPLDLVAPPGGRVRRAVRALVGRLL